MGLGAALGNRFGSGGGPIVDAAIGAVLAGLTIGVFALGIAVAEWVLRWVPRLLSVSVAAAVVGASWLLVESRLPRNLALLSAVVLTSLVAGFFGSIAALTGRSDTSERRRFGWVLPVAVLIASSVGLGGIALRAMALWPATSGSAQQARLGQPGSNPILPLRYETRAHADGAESNEPLSTRAVDATAFVSFPGGWRGKLREWYWGFDASALPLNASVWLPNGKGPFPLVLAVHGNALMTVPSELGYDYLGERLASQGFVFVSVDENFLNDGGPLFGTTDGEIDARAWLLLQHAALWRRWNATPGHPFEGLIDERRIALIGHSRGGEAVVAATMLNRLTRDPDDARIEFDFGFGIQAVVAIAPTDGLYRPAGHIVPLQDVSFLTIQGEYDADVATFYGDRIYNRMRFSDPTARWFKASAYFPRSNHAQFSSVWGRKDRVPPTGWFLDRSHLVSGAEQRRQAAMLIGRFLEATLEDRAGSRAFFRGHEASATEGLGALGMITRYEDATFRVIADFDEDVDVTSTTLPGGRITASGLTRWREGPLPSRRPRDRAVLNLAWDESASDEGRPAPHYTMLLPDHDAPSRGGGDELVLSLAEDPDSPRLGTSSPLDFSIELVSADGTRAKRPLSRFGAIRPPATVQLTGNQWMEAAYGEQADPILQTYTLPFEAFANEQTAFDPKSIRSIGLVFDRSKSGAIFVDRIGIQQAPPGPMQ